MTRKHTRSAILVTFVVTIGLALLIASAAASSGLISTVVGDGTAGDSGKGGPATAARVDTPNGVAVASDGSLYVADFLNNKVKLIAPGGDGVVNGGPGETITTVAGTGTAGFSGDSGAATSAEISRPVHVAPDGSDGFYISDRDNDRIRWVDEFGTISTVVGGGSGCTANMISPYDGCLGPEAALNLPNDIALDSAGNLYIADTLAHRVRKVVPGPDGIVNGGAGEVISTVAGDGDATCSGEGGQATLAKINAPEGLAVGANDRVYISSGGCQTVSMIEASGVLTRVAGTGTPGFSGDGAAATSAQLDIPRDIAFDDVGRLYIADLNNDAVRQVVATKADGVVDGDPDEIIDTIVGRGAGCTGITVPPYDGCIGTEATLSSPGGLDLGSANHLYIGDQGHHRVRYVVPKKQDSPGDTDFDGCTDAQENGANELLGGLRDYKNFWDFMDVWTDPTASGSYVRDRAVTIDDIFEVAKRFLLIGTETSVKHALIPPTSPTAYHASYDVGPQIGANMWNVGPASGDISIDDVATVASQYLHSC